MRITKRRPQKINMDEQRNKMYYFSEITGSACNHLIIFVIVFQFHITLISTRGEHEKHMQMLKIFLFRTLKTNPFSKIDYFPAYVQEKDCQTEI